MKNKTVSGRRMQPCLAVLLVWTLCLSVRAVQPVSLTLEDALSRALAHHPSLVEGQAAVTAAEARVRQAGVLPNPELEVEVEDIGLSEEEGRFDASVVTVRAGQDIELGGKRSARIRSAALESRTARLSVEAARLALIQETKHRFLDLLFAQERLRRTQSALELSRSVRNSVAERVRSGSVSPLEETKAGIEEVRRDMAVARCRRQRRAAREALGALCGASPREVASLQADADMSRIPDLPAAPPGAESWQRNPDLALHAAACDRAEAAVTEERAARIPDLCVSAAIAHERESGEQVLELGVSVPLPLFNRNRGNIDAARAECARAQAARRAAEIEIGSRVQTIWQELQAARDEAESLQEEILPAARDAFADAEEAYRSGKLGYLEVLDAQSTLYEIEMQWVETVAELYRAVTALERLVGGNLNR